MMTPAEIMDEVDAAGFCLTDLSDSAKHILNGCSIKTFSDGFYVDNEEHRQIFENTPELQNIVSHFKARASEQKISWNQILVCRVVEGGSKEKYRTHLDSHIYTMVVPLLMPKGHEKNRGQLFIVPNYRPQPRSEISNFVGKTMAGKFRGEGNFARVKSLDGYQEIDLKFGQVLIFNGMRCLHGNLANDGQEKRITLLSHFADPFPIGVGSMLRFIRKMAGTR